MLIGIRARYVGGGPGDMKALSAASKLINGKATELESEWLREYCQADVRNMFEIAYASEQLLFNRIERRDRRRAIH